MPTKVVVQTDDLFEPSPIGSELQISGLRGRQLVSTAIGAGTYFVLQSGSATLFKLRERIMRGLAQPGPALFNIFSGASGTGVPPYLTAAAAAESRAFPSFVYDPSAGPDWASRFSLDGNSQIDLDWPQQRFDYEDAAQQLVSENLAFTPVDFAACDPRCAKHFAKVPRTKWTADLVPVVEFLAREPKDLTEKVPCLLMVDRDNRLQKVVVNDRLVREARRCAEAWRSLQELGGVHNSHAAALVERERKAWAEQAQPGTEQAQPRTAAVQSQPGAAAAVPTAPARRPPKRRPKSRRTSLISRQPGARAAMNARRSTTRCLVMTPTNRRLSSIRMQEPTVNLWRLRRVAKSRSFTQASPGIRTSLDSTN